MKYSKKTFFSFFLLINVVGLLYCFSQLYVNLWNNAYDHVTATAASYDSENSGIGRRYFVKYEYEIDGEKKEIINNQMIAPRMGDNRRVAYNKKNNNDVFITEELRFEIFAGVFTFLIFVNIFILSISKIEFKHSVKLVLENSGAIRALLISIVGPLLSVASIELILENKFVIENIVLCIIGFIFFINGLLLFRSLIVLQSEVKAKKIELLFSKIYSFLFYVCFLTFIIYINYIMYGYGIIAGIISTVISIPLLFVPVVDKFYLSKK